MNVVDTRHLFHPLTEELLLLLERLPAADWSKPTCYPTWKVRDIVAHLIQTASGRLSAQRDQDSRRRKLKDTLPTFASVAEAIDQSNEQWEECFHGVSARLLLDLVKVTEPQLADFMREQSLEGIAQYSVLWAGEDQSENWFDIARELTERWHHQQQIRDAVGAPSIEKPEYLRPTIDTLIRSLPYWYNQSARPLSGALAIEVEGNSGGTWLLEKKEPTWTLAGAREGTAVAAILTIPERDLWLHLTCSVNQAETRGRCRVRGDASIAEPFFAARSVMIPPSS